MGAIHRQTNCCDLSGLAMLCMRFIRANYLLTYLLIYQKAEKHGGSQGLRKAGTGESADPPTPKI